MRTIRPPVRLSTIACIVASACPPAQRGCSGARRWTRHVDVSRLMRLATDGEIALTPQVRGHFDPCLGCMACVTACPSGVQLRQADRGDPSPDRAQHAAPAQRPHLPRADLRALPPSPADAPAAAAALALSEVGRASAGAEPMAATDAPAAPAGDGGGAAARPAATARGALVCADPGARRYAAHASGGAARLCAARLLRRCQRGDARVLAAEGYEVVPISAGLLRRAEHPRRTRTRGAELRPAADRRLRDGAGGCHRRSTWRAVARR